MAQIDSYPSKTVLIDSDQFIMQETSAGFTRKSLWSAIKSSLKTYFDTLYDTLGSAQTAADAVNTGLYKDAIINGNMNVSQENGTTLTALTTGDYVLDMFKYQVNGSMTFSGQKDSSTVPDSESQYSLLLDCTNPSGGISTGNYAILNTYIEGYNFYPYVGKTATLSFWVKGTKTGIHCVSFRSSTHDKSYVSEYTVNVSDTWEKKTITLDFDYSGGVWDYTNGVGLEITWVLASGSTYQTTTSDTWQTGNYIATSNQVDAADSTSNNFRIAQAQLNEGSTAMSFEHDDIQRVLAKCQRYYEISDTISYCIFNGYIVNANIYRVTIGFSVTKRSIPTITLTDAGSVGFAAVAPSIGIVSKQGFRTSKTSTLTSASGYYVFTWVADARF